MNIEQTHLQFFICTEETFIKYLNYLPQSTPLQSGKHLVHMSHCQSMASRYSGDKDVLALDIEGLEMYLSFVDGYLNDDASKYVVIPEKVEVVDVVSDRALQWILPVEVDDGLTNI